MAFAPYFLFVTTSFLLKIHLDYNYICGSYHYWSKLVKIHYNTSVLLLLFYQFTTTSENLIIFFQNIKVCNNIILLVLIYDGFFFIYIYISNS